MPVPAASSLASPAMRDASLRSVFLAAALLLAGLPAWAQDANREQAARARFEEGQHAYEAGDFPRAARAFQAAYELHASPELAFNVARISERAGDLETAIRYYDLYVQTGHLSEADGATFRATIARLRAERDRRAGMIVPEATSAELAGEARTFFERGVRMFRRRNYRAALVAFESAYSLSRSANARVPELHFNMAVTLERLAEKTRDRCQRLELMDRAAATYETYRQDAQLAPREVTELRAKIRALRAEPTCPPR